MITVSVDITDVLEATSTASKLLRGVPQALDKIGKDAAKYSRENHLYQNRTGRTQARTFAESQSFGGDAYTVVTIDVPHASYLMQGGTSQRHVSLTAMEDAIENAERELEYYVDGLGDQIDSL